MRWGWIIAAMMVAGPAFADETATASAAAAPAEQDEQQDQDLSGEQAVSPALSAPAGEDEAQPGGQQNFTGTNPMDNPYQALVDQRRKVQQRWPSDLEAIATWIENPAAFSIKALTGAGIMQSIAKGIPSLFPEETKPSSPFITNTKASPKIWEEPERFAELAKALEEAATQMLQGMQSMDVEAVRAGHKAASAACESCHADFVTAE